MIKEFSHCIHTSINPLKHGIDPDIQRGNQLFNHRNDFLKGIASCFRKQNLLHTSTERKSVFFRLFLRRHTRKNCRNIRNARGLDHTPLLLLPCWNSHLFCHPVEATEVHKYVTMNYPYCNLILDLNRSLVFILGQQRMRIIQLPTHIACSWVELGWGAEGVGSCPASSSVESANGMFAWERESELLALPPSLRTAPCVPPKLQTSSTFTMQEQLQRQFWESIEKIDKKEAQFWALRKCHQTPASKPYIVWFSRPKWQIPDHITGGVIEAIKQSSRDTNYQRILLSAAIKGIKYICNKQEQQKQKDQWHQLIPNNLQEKQMSWTGRKRSLSTLSRYINLKNPRWCSHWEKQMHRAGRAEDSNNQRRGGKNFLWREVLL